MTLERIVKGVVAMVITLEPDLEATLNDLAHQQGVAPEVLAVNALRERFRAPSSQFQPQDDWERGLLHAARDWGVSLSDSVLSCEGMYD